MHPAVQGFLTILIGVGGCIGYFWLSNQLLDRVLFPARGPNIGRNINRANLLRPWLFLFPALVALGLYLAYPVVETLRLSLLHRVAGGGYVWAGLENYSDMLGEPKFREALRNNMLWLIVVPAASTALGLIVAQLTDRIRWGAVAKSLIFMPMAISFVGASVIWKLIYDTRPADQPQIGVLNAVWMQFGGGFWSLLILKVLPVAILGCFILAALWAIWRLVAAPVRAGDPVWPWTWPLRVLAALGLVWLGWHAANAIYETITVDPAYHQPQTWLTLLFWNNFFLMAVLIRIQNGFAMVILSAPLRGIPEETVEAAIVDGAGPFAIFFRIKVPQIMSTIVVVWTTITIVVLKVFDIVYAMTNGQWETQVLANYMFDKLLRGAGDWGVGSASAMVFMLLVTPILVWNVWNARKEMR
jgi:alpha-glucoside transport system permease protein